MRDPQVTIDYVVCCFDSGGFEYQHSPDAIIGRILHPLNTTVDDAVHAAESLLHDSYNPYRVYNAVQGALVSIRHKNYLKKRKERMVISGCTLPGFLYGFYASGEIGGAIVGSLMALAIPAVIYAVRDVVRLCRKHKDTPLAQLEAVNAMLEKEVPLPPDAVPSLSTSLFYGSYHLELYTEPITYCGLRGRQVHCREQYILDDGPIHIKVVVEDGFLRQLQIEPLPQLPFSASRRKLGEFGAAVCSHLRFYSHDEEIAMFQ